MDEEVKFLLDSLEQEGILGCIDLVVMSDHGMASSPPGEKFLLMEDFIPNISNQARIYDGVVPSIRPNLDTEGMHISLIYCSLFEFMENISYSLFRGTR